jgi:lysine 2,3-aminomutase
VVDSPHGGGKIPVMPNYVISASDDAVVLRNYEGMMVRYQAEDRATAARPVPSRGVSALLQGNKSAIVPEDSERMARRKQLKVLEAGEGENGCCGGGSGEAHSHAPTAGPKFPLNVLANGCGS